MNSSPNSYYNPVIIVQYFCCFVNKMQQIIAEADSDKSQSLLLPMSK